MNFFRNIGIKGKLILILMFSITITSAVVGAIVYFFTLNKIKQQKITETEGVSKVIAFNAVPALQFLDESTATEVLSTIKAYPNVDVAYIEDDSGNEFSRYVSNQNSTAKPAFNMSDKPEYVYLDNALYSKFPIIEGDIKLGQLYIISNTKDLDAYTQALFIVIFGAFGALILLSFLFLLAVQGLVTSPIKTLLKGVQKISSEKNYSLRAEKLGNDEIGELTDQFNEMMGILEDNKNQLDSENERLDIQVKERTSELEKVNNQMQVHLKELKIANDELSQFVYIVSHDLKAPVRAIATLATFLEEDLGNDIDEDIKEHLTLIQSRTSRMKNLIEGLLEYSRTGKVEKKYSDFTTQEVFNEILSTFNDSKNYTIDTSGANVNLYADKMSLLQVMQNLVQNSIKYNDKENVLVSITFSEEENFYIFAVTDNGPGVEPKYHKRIFEVFRTLQGRDEIESTGLGLSIVKKIVEDNGGSIEVISDGKNGATFKFAWKKLDYGEEQ